MTPKPIIHLVDDDHGVLNSLRMLLQAAGHECRLYESAETFLTQLAGQECGCVIADQRMTGMDGLELQKMLIQRQSCLPLVVVSGEVDVDEAVEFMENGALKLLRKPYDPDQLLETIDKALEINRHEREKRAWISDIVKRIETLNKEERRVMDLIVEGKPNKAIAADLAISMRTVDRRRSSVFDKMRVKTVPELARLLTQAEIVDGSFTPEQNDYDQDDEPQEKSA